MGREGAAGEFVGAALRWWRGEEVGEPGERSTIFLPASGGLPPVESGPTGYMYN